MHTKIQDKIIKDIKGIYTRLQKRRGWDFSFMKTESEQAPWNYMDMVVRYLKKTDSVLDIGTGGGEKLIVLSKYFKMGAGIDADAEMVSVAQENAEKQQCDKVTFKKMNGESLKFADNTFDIVLNRHAPIFPREIARVLNPGGYFISQQVINTNMQNLKKAFHYTKKWKNDTKTVGREFEVYGCRVVATGHYDIRYWVKDVESLIFWLNAINLPENFTIEKHGKQLLSYMNTYQTPRGYITNEAREFLIIRKD